MTPERWARIKEIFSAALEKSEDERRAYLDGACGADATLREEVERLLAEQDAASLISPAAALLQQAAAPTLITGRMLRHYRVEEKLGEGGMGAVYRAYDTQLRRSVALKVLPREYASDPERRERLLREARAASALNHPNIVGIHEVGSDSGVDFIAMEFVEGKSLDEAIPAKGLPLAKALDYAVQIASGLAKAHASGVIHRDLKPGNIMVTREGLVKLLDFGLARRVEFGDEHETTLTVEGEILGTPSYMSPEQAEGRKADARSDVFAFGAVLYEMTTGRRAFQGDSLAGVVAAVMEKDPPPVSGVQPMTPPALDRAVKRCLAKDPDQRWQSIADVGDELSWIAEGMGRPEGIAPPGLMSRLRGQRRIILGLAVGLVAALGTIAALWFRGPSATPESSRRQVRRLVVKLPEGSIPRGSGGQLAFSSDGSKLVYAAQQGGVWRLYLHRLDQFQPTPIPGTDGGSTPFFSPDGNWVGFFAEGKLKKAPLAGGAPATLCESIPPGQGGGSWEPGGTIVFGTDSPNGLMRVSANGGAPQVLTTPKFKQGEMAHVWPEVLPGGRGVLFTIYRAGANRASSLAVLPLDGGAPRVLSEDVTFARYAATGHLLGFRPFGLRPVLALPFDLAGLRTTGPPVNVMEGVEGGEQEGYGHAPLLSISSEGSLAYVALDPKGRSYRMVWLDRAGNAQPLRPEQNVIYPALSPDGHQLAGSRGGLGGFVVWIWDLDRETSSRLSFEGNSHQPIWSPDGQWIVYSGGRESVLYRKRADGTGQAERLLTSAQHQDPGSWSPDGKLLAFAEFGGETGWDICTLSLEERAARPFLRTPFAEMDPMISPPDGRWLAYSSNESGRSEVYVQPFPNGGPRLQISSAGGDQPLWSSDGRELFFRQQDKVMVVAIEIHPEFRPGKPRVLLTGQYPTRDGHGHSNYGISRDGRRFLMRQQVTGEREGATEINIILNWSQELEQRLGSKNRTGD